MSLRILPIIFLVILVFLAPTAALVSEGLLSFGSFGWEAAASQFGRYAPSTLLLLVLSVLGASVLGLSTAYLCARFEFPMRHVVVWLSLLPLAVPSYLVAYAWVDTLVDLGVHGGQLRNIPLTAFVFATCLSPYIFLPSYNAFTMIPKSLVESSALLGRSRLTTFVEVELPLVWPSVFVGASLVGMEVLADFGTVDFMAVDTWSTGIFRSWFGLNDRARAAFLALMLFAASGVFLLWQLSANSKKSLYSALRSSALVPRRRTSVRASVPLLATTVIAPFVSCLAPVLILIHRTLVDSHSIALSDLFTPTWTTLWVAVTASVLVVISGFLFALASRLSGGQRLVAILLRLGTLGYAFPGGVLGVGLLIILSYFSLGGTLIALFFAYVIRFVTIGANTIETGWQTIPKRYVEQARLLGCSPLTGFVRVELPLLKKSVACAFALCCIDVVKELPATMLLMPLNFETLALRTYNLASDERLAETAPYSLLMIVVCGVGVLAAQKMGAFSLSTSDEAKAHETGAQ